MKLFSRLLTLLVVFFTTLAFAGNDKKGDVDEFAITQTSGMALYYPSTFYGGSLATQFPELPEMEVVNSSDYRDLAFLEAYLEQEGIALGLGVNPNRDSSFDLYAPFVGIVLDSPAEVFGMPANTEAGRMHFMTHDAVHLWAGIPGPRMEDLQDPEKLEDIKDRLVQVILDKEALASAWTAFDYIKYYWNWRDGQGMNYVEKKALEFYNSGLFSVGDISRDDFMSILLTVANRRPMEHFRLVNKNIDSNYIESAMHAGVPMLFPNMRFENETIDRLAVKAQSKVFRGLLPVYSAIDFLERSKTGHTYQKAFARGLTEYYYQEWFVKWATMFNIGLPIDEMEEQLNDKINAFRQNKHFADIPNNKPLTFELQYTKNEVAQFGRRIIEMQEALKIVEKHAGRDSSAQVERLEELLNQAAELAKSIQNHVDTAEVFSDEDLHKFQTQSYALIKKASEEFNVDTVQADGRKLLPDWARPPHSDFSNYWFDSFAYAVRRPDIMVAFINAEGIMKEMRQMNQDEAKAIRSGKDYNFELEETEVKSAFMEQFLAQLYRQNNALPSEVPTVDEAPGENDYLKRMHVFSMAIQEQVYSVAMPQLMQFNSLENSERKEVSETIDKLATTIQAKIAKLVQTYKDVYLKGENVSEKGIIAGERQILTAVNNMNTILYRVLNTLEEGKTYSAIKADIEALDKTRHDMMYKTVEPAAGTVAMQNVPRSKRGLSKVCSAITKACTFGSIRGKAKTTSLGELVQVDGNEVAIDGLDQFDAVEEDAVYIFLSNNDNSILDVKVANQVAKKLGVKKDFVLADEQAQAQQSMFSALDGRVINEGSANWEEKAIKKLSGKGKRSLTVLPESNVPTYGAQMPLIAKTKGFEFAAKVAKELAGKKKVYAVTVTTNGLEAATSRDQDVEFKANVTAPVLVPEDADADWVNNHRAAFESYANLGRGKAMTDLLVKTPIRNSNVPAASATRPMKDFQDFFNQWNTEQRSRVCEKFFELKI